jgi:glycosyltransferase involved in cell wall biosynthesis
MTKPGDEGPLHVLQVTEVSGAGTLRVVQVLCDGLTVGGHRVTVVHARHPDSPGPFPGHADSHALAWDRRRPGSQVRAARRLRRLIADLEPDLVHLHSTFAGLVGGLARRGSPPHVYTSHGWASSSPRRRPLPALVALGDRWIIRRADLVGAVSDSDADLGARLGARRVAIVPNGIPEIGGLRPPSARSGSATGASGGASEGEVPGRPSARSGSGPPVVVSGGRLVPDRRPEEAARILREVHDVAKVRWVGGGEPAEEAGLEALGVEVTGWLPHAGAVDHIAAAQAYLHWSACDGQSVAVLEAMARDVVVVASDIPANRELLSPFQLCRTPREAAVKLRRVVQEPDLRDELLDAQRVRRRRHGASGMVQGWIGVYRSTIARAARSSA